jgi:hypothetical protein
MIDRALHAACRQTSRAAEVELIDENENIDRTVISLENVHNIPMETNNENFQ